MWGRGGPCGAASVGFLPKEAAINISNKGQELKREGRIIQGVLRLRKLAESGRASDSKECSERGDGGAEAEA